MHYILFYDVVDDFIAKRATFRNEHLALARQAHQRGDLVLAGALADPVDGAVLVFRGPSPQPAEAFAKLDPYVTNGLVTAWRVRKWTTVVGEGPSTP
jgi:uncharacterized protein YciI